MNKNKKDLLIGIGIGLTIGCAVGGTTGYFVSKKRSEKKSKARAKDAYKHGYEKAIDEAKVWIDEYKAEVEKNMIIVDTTDPESAQKAVSEYIEAAKTASEGIERTEGHSEPEAVKRALEGRIEASVKGSDEDKNKEKKAPSEAIVSDNEVEQIFASPKGPEDAPVNIGTKRYYLGDDGLVHIQYHREMLEYPKSIFYDENGYEYGQTRIRANLFQYEKNAITLKKLWLALGWGDYFPDPDDGVITEEELNAMDLEIDEQLGDEPEERTIERQRYLDKVEAFKNNPVNCPKIVPQRTFEEDCYLNHIYVDYYDVDNVFVDSTDIENKLDAVTMFGVADGKELFAWKAEHPFPLDEDNGDPEVVHVENFFDNSIAEITRYHKSFASIRDGSAYVDGSSTEI
jgi:hypothetical protein